MTQTITLQRGSVTLASSATSLLFANSATGTATRLIIGYLSWTSDFPTVFGRCNFAVLRNGAASPNFNVFAANFSGGSAKTISYSPHDMTSGHHGQGVSSTEHVPAFFNTNTGMIGASAKAGGAAYMAIYNKYIIIGPSDEIHVSWFDNGGGSQPAVIQFCFTLITE